MKKERKNKKVRKDFSYHVTEEEIKSYMKVPAYMKLRWLEEAIRFSYYSLSMDKRKIWEMFRKGEI